MIRLRQLLSAELSVNGADYTIEVHLQGELVKCYLEQWNKYTGGWDRVEVTCA